MSAKLPEPVSASPEPPVEPPVQAVGPAGDAADPIPRVSQLKAANKTAVTVSRDTPIPQAVTQMLVHDYSQLPVMNGSSVVGLFSWKTYGEARALGKTCEFVRDCMDRTPLILRPATPLLDAVVQVAARDVAVVHDKGRLHGIITTSDLSLEFHASARPFLLLGSIENNLRAIFAVFGLETLSAAAGGSVDGVRPINGPHELSFGGYIRVLQDPANWSRVSTTLDRGSFLDQLDRVRLIRNAVMHFHAGPVEDDKIAQLESTLRALQMLRAQVTARTSSDTPGASAT